MPNRLPLTHTQHRFFQKFPEDMHYPNKSVLLVVSEAIDKDALARAVRHWYAYHESLRVHFLPCEQEWVQWLDEPGEKHTLKRLDFSEVPDSNLRTVIEETNQRIQEAADVTQSVARIYLYDTGIGRESRLFLTLHKLICDPIGMNILLSSLETFYRQEIGEDVPQKRGYTSLSRYLALQTREANDEGIATDMAYWKGLPWDKLGPLPLDFPENRGNNPRALQDWAWDRFDEEELERITNELMHHHQMTLRELLLVAFALGYQEWTGQSVIQIEEYKQSRDRISWQTEGYIVSHSPVVVDLSDANALAEDRFGYVCRQIRAIPRRGRGYGLLRHFHNDPRVRQYMACLPTLELMFSYDGLRTGHDGRECKEREAVRQHFQYAPEWVGQAERSIGNWDFALGFAAKFSTLGLEMMIGYNKNLHHQQTAETLLGNVMGVIRTALANLTETDRIAHRPIENGQERSA